MPRIMAISACNRQSLVVVLVQMGAKSANHEGTRRGNGGSPHGTDAKGERHKAKKAARLHYGWLTSAKWDLHLLGGKRAASCHSAS